MLKRFFEWLGMTRRRKPWASTTTTTMLLSPLSLSNGGAFHSYVAASGVITGATAGSTITASGLPSGLAINGAARTWNWTGGPGSSGSFTLTESLAGYPTRTSTISYTNSVVAPPPPPPPPPPSSVVYDTSVGNGVDINGSADLPLRAGAKYIYCGAGGSNSNTGLSHAQRKLTVNAAQQVITVNGNAGDQILVAEGTTDSVALDNMIWKGGFSYTYPTVIQSYDPNDSTNTAKYGRATGTNRPVLSATGTTILMQGPDTSPQFIAFRGLDFSVSLSSGNGNLSCVPNTTGQPDGVLWENCIFRNVGTGYNGASHATLAQHWIFRNCSFYGQFDPVSTSHSQALYLSKVDNYTIEDCVFYHVGYKIGANITDDPSLGGATIFRHAVYAQADTRNGIVRRNLSFRNANESFSLRGSVNAYQNLGLFNSEGISLGSGSDYNTDAPSGVDLQASYNAMFGGASASNGATDWGIGLTNGTSGSSAHHNLLARSSAKGGWTFGTTALFPQPSYADYHHNVAYEWANSGSSTSVGLGSGVSSTYLHDTYNNNYWDDPASGTNLNKSSLTTPNAYTYANFFAALGYASEAAFTADVINHPELHVQRQGVKLLLLGYGVDTSAMPFLV